MLSIKVKPTFQRVGKAFQDIDMKSILRKVNEEIAFAVERFSKQVTPVDTGRLRSSISVSNAFGGNIRSFVAPHTHYAGFVHEGTRKMAARPFMKWGVDFTVLRYKGEIGWKIDTELRKKLSNL